jgi:hypothetical protein
VVDLFEVIIGMARLEIMMGLTLKKILFWAPRILGILFALFVSIFALDVFGAGYSFWNTLIALFMHLIPVYLLLIGLAIAWRQEWVGAAVFIGFSVWYLIAFGGQFPWSVYLVMAGLPFVIGVLFIFSHVTHST